MTEIEALRSEIAALRDEISSLRRLVLPPTAPPSYFWPQHISPTVAPLYPGGPFPATS